MEINAAIALLNGMPSARSDYEFKNFNLELYGTFPRQLRAMLIEKESLTDQLTIIEADIDTLNVDTASNTGGPYGAAVSKRNGAKINQLRRQAKGINEQLKQVDDWLDSQEMEHCEDAIADFEDTESEHWTDHLGRIAAIEVLAHGRTQTGTLRQLSQLPLGDFKKSVIIISQLANFLKDTTTQAESTLFPQQDTIPNGDVSIKE